jgi:DNA polymerase-3 subunit beta
VHVQLNPKRFLERFRPVATLTSKRSYPRPVLETVQMEVTADGKAFLRATDLEATIAVAVPVLKVLAPGIVQLPRDQVVKPLADVKVWSVDLEEIPPETLPLSADPKVPTKKMSLRTPRSTVVLSTFDPEHFPVLSPGESTGEVTLPAWRLVRLIERTEFAADEDSTRYALGGCAFESEGGKLHCIATDGRCLAHAFEDAGGTALQPPTTTIVGGEERPLSPTVPRRALKALAVVLGTMENTRLTLAFTKEGRFEVRAPDFHFTSRLLEGRFPPWKEVLPESSKTSLRVVDTERLQKALKDAYRFTSRESRATVLTLHRSTLTISVSTDQASTSIVLPVQNTSEDREVEASVTIDPSYLLSYLGASRRTFDLWFPPEKHTPLLCQSEGLRYAFMPMERDEEKKPSEATEEPQDNDQEEPPAEEAREIA